MENTRNLLLPFDAYCPSIQSRLHSRVCSICKQYIPLASRLRNHYRVHQQRYALTHPPGEEKKEDEAVDELDPEDNLSRQYNLSQPAVFLFADIADWLKSDFEELPVVPSKSKSTATIANEMIRKEHQATTEKDELPIRIVDVKTESVAETDTYDDLSDLLDKM